MRRDRETPAQLSTLEKIQTPASIAGGRLHLTRVFGQSLCEQYTPGLVKRKSAKEREKFSEVFKENECVAKLTKVKAAKKETKEKATDPKGKGKQQEITPTHSSTKRSKQT